MSCDPCVYYSCDFLLIDSSLIVWNKTARRNFVIRVNFVLGTALLQNKSFLLSGRGRKLGENAFMKY